MRLIALYSISILCVICAAILAILAIYDKTSGCGWFLFLFVACLAFPTSSEIKDTKL